MTANGTALANRDATALRDTKTRPRMTESPTGLAEFRVLARRIMNSHSGKKNKKYETLKVRLFSEALKAIQRGLDNNERWAVKEALALTIGSVKTFVEDDISSSEGEIELTLTETHIQTQTQTIKAARG